jgi:hypothetical protein
MLLSFLLQEGPADTTSYMIAGYAIIFGVMLLYLISLLVRQRNLQKDMEVLEEIQAEDQ